MRQAYYFFNSGTLKRKDNTLEFTKEDGSKSDIPIERVDDLYVFSEMNLNTRLLEFLSQKGVCVHFFNYYEYYTGTFYPRERLVSGKVLVCQVQHYENITQRLSIAQSFIHAASFNIHRNIRYYNERDRDLDQVIVQIESLRQSIKDAASIEELMGIEGNIRKEYYQAWNSIIKQEIKFDKRVKRPPDNMINSLISFINSLMYSRVLSEIYKTQLNPTISFLHQPSTKRYSLSLDIAEIFKPLLVDRLIFTLLNKNMIDETCFEEGQYYWKLKSNSMRTIVEQFDKRLKTTIKHRDLGREVSYQYLIRLELYKLVKHLIGEKEYEGFTIWW